MNRTQHLQASHQAGDYRSIAADMACELYTLLGEGLADIYPPDLIRDLMGGQRLTSRPWGDPTSDPLGDVRRWLVAVEHKSRHAGVGDATPSLPELHQHR